MNKTALFPQGSKAVYYCEVSIQAVEPSCGKLSEETETQRHNLGLEFVKKSDRKIAFIKGHSVFAHQNFYRHRRKLCDIRDYLFNAILSAFADQALCLGFIRDI